MVSLPSILVSPRSTFDFPCFLSGDAVLIQQAKGFKTQCFMIRHQRRIPYSDNVSLSRSGKCLCLVEANFSCCTTNQTHYPDLGNDASSVWIFCAPFLHVISQETSCGVTKCRQFSQAISKGTLRSDNSDTNENVAKK